MKIYISKNYDPFGSEEDWSFDVYDHRQTNKDYEVEVEDNFYDKYITITEEKRDLDAKISELYYDAKEKSYNKTEGKNIKGAMIPIFVPDNVIEVIKSGEKSVDDALRNAGYETIAYDNLRQEIEQYVNKTKNKTEGENKMGKEIKAEEETGYQGYSNTQTFQVSTWMSNDKEYYDITQDMLKSIIENGASTKSEDNGKIRSEATVDYADALKELFEEDLNNLAVEGLWRDLLTWALGDVNWFEIAENEVNEYNLNEENKNAPVVETEIKPEITEEPTKPEETK